MTMQDLEKAMEELRLKARDKFEITTEIKRVEVSGESQEVEVRKLAKLALPLEKAWHFIDGKKKYIGAVVVGTAFIPGVDPVLSQVLKWVGGSIFTGAAIHTGAKMQTKIGAKGEFGSGELAYAFKQFIQACIGLYNAWKNRGVQTPKDQAKKDGE